MSSNAFIRRGHGYEQGSMGRCTAFDGFTVIAAPLHQEGDAWEAAFGAEARAKRVFHWETAGGGTDYGSHALKLAKADGPKAGPYGLYILVHHGAGREVLHIPQFYDGGALETAILAMPEPEQYALLYTIWKTARNARVEAKQQTARYWAQAHLDNRIRTKRATRTRGKQVYVEPEKEGVQS